MDAKKDIKTREDIDLLVRTFYGEIRKDTVLGPIFERAINDWEKHFKILGDFWESSIFLKGSFKGDPISAHQKVDQQENNSINTEHFGLWMRIWFDTIDKMFVGEMAESAKHKARKMSTYLYLKIFEMRNK